MLWTLFDSIFRKVVKFRALFTYLFVYAGQCLSPQLLHWNNLSFGLIVSLIELVWFSFKLYLWYTIDSNTCIVCPLTYDSNCFVVCLANLAISTACLSVRLDYNNSFSLITSLLIPIWVVNIWSDLLIDYQTHR